MTSKMLVPCGDDLVKMLEDDLAHLASQTWRAVVLEILGDIEPFRMDPILAFGISLDGVHVHWFGSRVRLEVASPSLQVEDRGHRLAIQYRACCVDKLGQTL